MRSGLDFATIASRNYWPQVLVLAESLRRCAPASRMHVLALDDVQDLPSPAMAVTRLDDLELDHKRLRVCLTVTERATAVKPAFLQHLFSAGAGDRLAYVDPDLLFLSPLSPVEEALERSDVVITPHFADEAEPGSVTREIQFARGGIFNLGFIALRRSPTADRLLSWWGQRALAHSSEDALDGMFTDQRWVDYVPAMFPGVFICRDPGLNVAPWNITGRRIEKRDGVYHAAGRPLVFFHFSKFRLQHADLLTFLEGRPCSPATRELVAEYAAGLERWGARRDAVASPGETLSNGEPVPQLMRQVIRELDDEGRGSWRTWGDTPEEILQRALRDPLAGARVRVATHAAARSTGRGPSRQVADSWRLRLWFYLRGPARLRIPIEWVESRTWVRGLRAALGGLVRRIVTLARGVRYPRAQQGAGPSPRE